MNDDDPKPLSDDERTALLGELPTFLKEGRCTHRMEPEETDPGKWLLGVIRSFTGPMPKLCGEPVTEPDLLGRPSCAKHAEAIRKATREGKNLLGILSGRHRSQ